MKKLKGGHFSNFDFPDDCEWMLSRLNNVFIGKNKKPQWGYDFDLWIVGNPTNSIARFKTKTPKQMADKIKKLSKRLGAKK